MALNPNVPVVNPGELITSAHLNNVRSNLDRIDQAIPTAVALRVAKAGDTMTGNLYMVGNPGNNETGSVLRADGIVHSRVNTPSAAATANVYLHRGGTPTADAGATIVSFGRSATSGGAVTIIGSIAIAAGATGVVYNTTSDERLKTLTRAVDPGEAVDKVAAMQPVNFLWTSAPDAGEQTGFIAQDLVTVAPEAVTVGSGEPGDVADADGVGGFVPWQVDLTRLVPTLVAAVQALTARIEQLEATP